MPFSIIRVRKEISDLVLFFKFYVLLLLAKYFLLFVSIWLLCGLPILYHVLVHFNQFFFPVQHKRIQWFWSHLKSFSCIFNNISCTTAFFHSFSKSNSILILFFSSSVLVHILYFISVHSFRHIRAINNVILQTSERTVTALTVTVICDNYKKIVIS